MKHTVNLNGRPSKLVVRVRTGAPTHLTFMGYDSDLANKPNTFYFAREKKVAGDEVLEFPMPLSPMQLTIDINRMGAGGGGMGFSVLEIRAEELPSRMALFQPGTYEFAKFVMKFCEQAGYLKTNFYISNDEDHVIWFKDKIDTSGTPAKVNRRTGVIKVSVEKFRHYTIPMRIFILLHEYYHWKYATTDEIHADMGALRTYVQLQFPKTEANYAMTKIFPDTPFSRMRAQKLDEYIKSTERRFI
jgi:hypothetical protein